MLDWVYSNWANILVIGVVILLVAAAVIVMVRDRKAGRNSCGCNCANCVLAGKCHSAASVRKRRVQS